MSGKPFRLHNVLMKPAPVASAGEEPVISVPSSPRQVIEEAAVPGKDGPVSIPDKGQDAMVCVMATRSSQTPPLIVPDIQRVQSQIFPFS